MPFATFVFHEWLPLWGCITVLSSHFIYHLSLSCLVLSSTYIAKFILPFLWGLCFSQLPSVCRFIPSPALFSIGVSLDPFAASFHPFPITFSSSANSCHLYWYSIHSGFKIHLGCFCFIIAMIWITVGVVFHRSHWIPQKSLHCCLSSFPSSLVSNAPESFSKKWDCTLCGSCLLTISLIVQVTLVFFSHLGPLHYKTNTYSVLKSYCLYTYQSSSCFFSLSLSLWQENKTNNNKKPSLWTPNAQTPRTLLYPVKILLPTSFSFSN